MKISALYTQSQNGGAERASGVITLRSISLLAESKFPKNMWPKVAAIATYLLNCTLIRALK